jgi:hypothetical protein
MQLIMERTNTDGYTYTCVDTTPLIHESPEAAAIEFEAAMRQGMESGVSVEWKGVTYYPSDYFPYATYSDDGECQDVGKYEGPYFFTVDEWFAHRGVGQP